MSIAIVLAALAVQPVAAQADVRSVSEHASDRPVLWRNLQAGMPKAAVKQLYPDFKAEILDQCGVRVLSTYKNGGLRGVILVNRGKPNGCADRLLEDYTRQIGTPDKGEHSQYAMLLPHSISADTYHWVLKGVDITLFKFRQSADWYNLIFREADGVTP